MGGKVHDRSMILVMFMADDQDLMTCELPTAVMASQSVNISGSAVYMNGETVSLRSCSGSVVGNFTCRDGDWMPQIPSLSPCTTDTDATDAVTNTSIIGNIIISLQSER